LQALEVVREDIEKLNKEMRGFLDIQEVSNGL
jgi:hypothetical protein